MTLNAEAVARALGGARKSGGGWMARCPCHADKTASLKVDDGEGGRVLLHCHAGCAQDVVIEACKTRGLWPEPSETPRRMNGHAAGAKRAPEAQADPAAWKALLPVPEDAPAFDPVAVFGKPAASFWDYQDSRGRLLGYAVRFDRPQGGKDILPCIFAESPDGKRAWRSQHFPPPRPLYGLAQLAERPTDPVLIVEGEKTCCAARELIEDHVCLTWPGGSNAVDKADWRRLKGRRVVIWPDADEPGRKAAQAVADAVLRAGATDARIVQLPADLPKGWDLADEILAGLDIGRLIAEAKDVRCQRLATLPIKSMLEIEATEYPQLQWAVPGLIPSGVTILAGPKSRGKSFISLDVAIAVASGGYALGSIQCEAGSVLYLALEDGERRIKERTRAVLQGRPVPAALYVATEWRTLDDGGLDDIETWITTARNPRLVIIDVLAKVKGRPDPQRGVYDQDYALITPFHALARRHGVAIVLVHHTNKGSAADPVLRISGTMGLSGAADTTLVLSREARDMHGTLDVRGRDVPEREIALQFDPDTGCCTQLGAADDFRKSEERRAVIRALIDAGPSTPAEIAQALGKKAGTVRMALQRMKKAGEITALANGRYQANE